jgi:hypothetical protein
MFPALYEQPVIPTIEEVLIVGFHPIVLWRSVRLENATDVLDPEPTHGEEPRRAWRHVPSSPKLIQQVLICFKCDFLIRHRPP